MSNTEKIDVSISFVKNEELKECKIIFVEFDRNGNEVKREQVSIPLIRDNSGHLFDEIYSGCCVKMKESLLKFADDLITALMDNVAEQESCLF